MPRLLCASAKSGFNSQRPAERGRRFVQLSLLLQNVAQVAVGSGEVRRQFERPAEEHGRFVRFSLVLQGVAQVVVGLGVIGLELQGPAVSGQGLLQPSLLLENVAQIVVGLRAIRIELQRLPVAGQRFVRQPLVLQRDAQVVVGLDIIRPELQGPAKGGHGFGQLSLLLQDDAQVAVGLRRPDPVAGPGGNRPRLGPVSLGSSRQCPGCCGPRCNPASVGAPGGSRPRPRRASLVPRGHWPGCCGPGRDPNRVPGCGGSRPGLPPLSPGPSTHCPECNALRQSRAGVPGPGGSRRWPGESCPGAVGLPQIAVQSGHRAIDLDRPFQILDGRLVAARLVSQQAQQVRRVDVFGFAVQNPAIEILCRREATRSVMLDGQGQGLGNPVGVRRRSPWSGWRRKRGLDEGKRQLRRGAGPRCGRVCPCFTATARFSQGLFCRRNPWQKGRDNAAGIRTRPVKMHSFAPPKPSACRRAGVPDFCRRTAGPCILY